MEQDSPAMLAAGEGRPGKHLSSRDDERATWKVKAPTGERSLQGTWGGGADGSVYPGQAAIQLLPGLRDGEPTSCGKWGRFRSLQPGDRLEVAC